MDPPSKGEKCGVVVNGTFFIHVGCPGLAHRRRIGIDRQRAWI
jgi:hypothetical protein